MKDLLAALDLGTTSVRAMVFEEGGATVAHASRRLPATFPHPGWVEQNAEELWRLAEEALGEACGPLASNIAALGIATQRSSVVAWDGQTGRPLAPVIGWQDVRTAHRAAELRSLGVPANTQASATKVEWLLANEPDVAAAARSGRLRLGTPDAWIARQLGATCTDPTNASTTLLYDITTADWHPGLLDLFGVDPAWLPPVRSTAAVVGETQIAGVDIALAARAGDQQAASFGLGITRPGDAKLTLGTSAMLDVNTGTDLRAPSGTYPLALWQLLDDNLTFCTEGSVHAAGATFEWLADLGVLSSVADLDAAVAAASDDHGMTMVPAMFGLGAPHVDDSARARLDGMTRASTAADLVAAAVTGVAHSVADLCDALELTTDTSLRVDGGLAQSAAMVQSLADVCGRPILRSAQVESTALGAALLAGLATGVYASAENATQANTFDPVVVPRADRAAERARWAESVARVTSKGLGATG